MKKIRILYADDEKPMLTLVSNVLGSKGIHVTTAVNGKEALQLAEKEKFDLFLMDLAMPVLSGFEFLKRVKSTPHLAHIPIIILTGDRRDHSVLNCMKHGASDYLVKPIELEVLHSRILMMTHSSELKIGPSDDSTSVTGLFNKSVLIIDSDPHDTYATKSQLRNLGIPSHRISSFTSVQAATDFLENNRPDLILLDPFIPTIEDGFVLIGRIQKNPETKKTPIILVTQFEIPEKYLNVFQIGKNDYLLKPLQKNILGYYLERASNLPQFKNRRLGDLLLEKEYINKEQLQLALMFQHQMSCRRLSVGALALIKGYMKFEEVAGLYPIFEIDDLEFLKLAVKGEFLTQKQADELLTKKQELDFRLGDVLVALGFIKRTTLESLIESRDYLPNICLNKREMAKTVGESLVEKIRVGKIEEALMLINEGDSINQKNAAGVSPLMMAAATGKKKVVDVLLDKGVHLDDLNLERWTALHFAVFNDHIEIVTMLLNAGAKIDLNDRWGRSVMDLAREMEHKEILWLLGNL